MKAGIFGAFLAIAVGLSGCSVTNTTVPDNLVGVWNTKAPKYAGRYFELKKDTVIFGMGNGKATPSTVVKVTEKRDKERSLFEILYLVQEGKSEKFSFYYEPATSTIRIKSQEKMDWTKGEAETTTTLAAASIPASTADTRGKVGFAGPDTGPKNPIAGVTSENSGAGRPKGSMTPRHDSFVFPDEPVTTPTAGPPVLPPREPGIMISQTVLEGVAPAAKGMVAMIGGPNGRIYFLYANDPLYNGRVARITSNSIVFEEEVSDSNGQPRTREVVKHLKAED
jgi:hypothetical protein